MREGTEREGLLLRCRQLEQAIDWYLHRIRQLEAAVWTGMSVEPAAPPAIDLRPDDRTRYLDRIRLLEQELEATRAEAVAKQAVIVELSEACDARLAVIETLTAELEQRTTES